MVRKQDYSVSTNYPFWRISIPFFVMIVLGFMRWYVWTLDTSFNLFCNAFVGPLGIKALLCLNSFHPDVEADRKTGEIRKTSYEVQTVISQFGKVLSGMHKSRDKFERSPDTGFFGKNFSRLWNLFEVYFIRFFLAGIIVALILFPIAIILNTIISLILALTSWLWMPIALIFRFIFSTLLYDSDGISKYESINQTYLTTKGFPLPKIIIIVIYKGIFQTLISIIGLFIVHPIAAIIMVVFACLRYCLRTLYDSIMICIVKYIGRVPASESNIAWRIGGPGISRKYYFEISKEDIFVLLYAELEKTLLLEYKAQLEKKILKPKLDAEQILLNFFSSFDAHRPYYDQSEYILIEQLRNAIYKRQERFPLSPQNSIRFTAQELVQLLKLTKKFIKVQIKLKDMNNYVWTHYEVKEGDYKELTKILWQRTFRNEDILEPFEDLEMRFKLTSNNRSLLDDNQIKQALKGTIDLEKESYIPKIKSKPIHAAQPSLQYVNPNDIIEQIILTQQKENQWSSHLNQQLAVYLNYKIKEKNQPKKPNN